MTSKKLEPFRSAYSILALFVLNTIALFVLANLVAALVMARTGGPASRPGSLRYPRTQLARVYPGWSEADIEDLLVETWSREYAYRPFVQHREAPRAGRYVNIHPAGFREVEEQGPWPPVESALNVFAFGGSTTFGYGLPDRETIPSRIQARLNSLCERDVCVYNFGGGNFYSDQERALFEGLLSAGIRPDVATFLDGLNEWKDVPKFTRRLEYLMGESNARLALRALKTLPLVRGLSSLQRGESGDFPRTETEVDTDAAPRYVERWQRNRRLIQAAGEAFGVETLFAWQPVPSFGYDLASHAFAEEARRAIPHDLVHSGYQQMDRWRSGFEPGSAPGDFLWLAGLQKGRLEPLYVDAAHYTAAFSEEIALPMADRIGQIVGCAAAPEDRDD